MRRLATALAVGSVVLGLAACGGGDGKTTIKTKEGELKVDTGKNNGSFSVKDKNGNETSFGASAELPKDFPKSDVPLPKGTITGSIFGSQGGKKTWTVTIDASGKISDVADSYGSKLEDAGYTVEQGFGSTSAGTDFASFVARGDKWDVNVAGSTDTKTKKAQLVVTVLPHDKSADTTTTEEETTTS